MKSKKRFWYRIGFRLLFTLKIGVAFLTGCGDVGSNDHKVLSHSEGVPIIHLVVDKVEKGRSSFSRLPQWKVFFHIQSDNPVEHDTFVLVREISDGERVKDKLVVLLAGRTQSELLDASDTYITDEMIARWNSVYGNEGWEQWGKSVCISYEADSLAFHRARIEGRTSPNKPRFVKVKNASTGEWDVIDETGFYICRAHSPYTIPGKQGLTPGYDDIDKVVKLPPAHERTNLLPTAVSYDDEVGNRQGKQLLVEYPFNPYKVGDRDTISLKEQATLYPSIQ